MWFASGELAYAAGVDTEPLVAVPLAARIRLLRAKLGISQEQLARKLGVSFATVNRWESGRSQPSARARRAIDGLAGGVTEEPEDLAGQGSAAVLPAAQSSFVGRERELAELAAADRPRGAPQGRSSHARKRAAARRP